MTIRSRLNAVERTAAQLLPPANVCPTCGGPFPGYNYYEIRNDEGELLSDQCADCGLALDDSGNARAAAPMPLSGKIQVKQLILARPFWDEH